MTEYTPGVGHNVLQLGTATVDGTAKAGELVRLPGWQKAGGIAPLRVERLDATGGSVTVHGSACYDGLTRWLRSVRWDAYDMHVTDEVVLADTSPDTVLFRWHLGTEEAVMISGEGKEFAATCPNAEIHIEADTPLVVTQRFAPDNTLAGHVSEDVPQNIHTCIIVQSAAPVNTISISTQFSSK